MNYIAKKTELLNSLKSFYSLYSGAIKQNYQWYDSIPISFIIEPYNENKEYLDFAAHYQKIAINSDPLTKNQYPKNIWLVKPENQNQGMINNKL